MGEKNLIKAAKNGDDGALAELFQSSYPFLLKYLLKLTYNRQNAEDLVQETYSKAIENLSRFKGTSKFSTWLISIATRLYLDQQRRRKRELNWLKQEQSLRKLKWEAQSNNQVWDDVMEALGQLNDGLRVPVILKHYYGFSYEEIGAIISIPEGTVKSRVHKGIKTIRKELAPNEEGSVRISKTLSQE
ncbi:RNA polymerase sigma factor SigY [Peribacillus muralis]|uniref:RNA polymerase sigma factor SigY n=1 Tax=Peribacillus muralis TaxID=264697 RepID=A0A1B3XKN8_9BACI|nr:RNA polymerase sigma factor SigY [Peribacillus muralis]AOH53780.1 RNA polymerase sigma factor SigY [Peribacillus muralis]